MVGPILELDRPLSAYEMPKSKKVSDADRAAVQKIKTIYATKFQVQLPYHRTWILNHAMLLGNHYLTPTTDGGFQVPLRKEDRHRVRMQVGLPEAYFGRTISRLTSARPEISVSPATNTYEDIRRAELGQGVSDYLWDKLEMQRVIREAAAWMIETGNGIIRYDWNPEAGPIGADGKPIGEHWIRAESPYDYFIDPQAGSLEEAEWIMTDRVKTLRWIQRNYPERGKDVKPETIYPNQFFAQRLKNMVGLAGSSIPTDYFYPGGPAKDVSDKAVVIEHLEKPTDKHPDGRRVIIAGDVLLYEGPWPYAHKQFPIVLFKEIAVPGRVWGQARSEQGNRIVLVIDRVLSQMIEIGNYLATPRILIPTQLQIPADAFTGGPGEKIPYMAGPDGAKPEAFKVGEIPSSQLQLIQTLTRQWEDAMAMHESSRGLSTDKPRSGRIVSLLQSADDTILASVSDDMQDALTKGHRMLLSNTAQFYTEERIAVVGGRRDSPRIFKFRGAELTGKDPMADYYSVTLRAGTALPRDRASLVAEVKELYQTGAIDKHDPRVLHIMQSLGYVQELMLENIQDETNARRENDEIAQGRVVDPTPIENFDVHLKEHRQFMKSGEWKLLSPWKRRLFMEHYYKTLQMQAESMGAPMGGLPPGPGMQGGGTETIPLTPGQIPMPVAPGVGGSMEPAAMQREQAADLAAGQLQGIA